MNGMITCDENYNIHEILPKLKQYELGNVVEEVSCKEDYEVIGAKMFEEDEENLKIGFGKGEKQSPPVLVKERKGVGKRVALLDLGAKENIILSLAKRGCFITVYPAWTKAEEILRKRPDGIMLSNGPGDPKSCVSIIKEIKKLYDADIPIFAICLGHQLMNLATGGDTYKLKYGHRGENHPVKDLKTGRVI